MLLGKLIKEVLAMANIFPDMSSRGSLDDKSFPHRLASGLGDR
jgi:hypothetical protein